MYPIVMDLHNCVFHGTGKTEGYEYNNSLCTCIIVTSCLWQVNFYLLTWGHVTVKMYNLE